MRISQHRLLAAINGLEFPGGLYRVHRFTNADGDEEVLKGG